ncbi:RNase P subunit p30-domain-containing protein [Zychaea mexicana]|uniref:RNase P subunit p30-domain-containing protein n=1 Tax=Zychaea mexicana TaxID=64656 RepID=UPI0022FE8946|nr:RNase P subunit p30-domain-containing protein [Zychaea mexicana]KAI9494751.1 RNase P subunit p30-domain-containing protein [Zychaea mexicana]
MFYDFNIPFPSLPNQEDLERLDRILSRIQSIQNATVAFNVSTSDPFTSKAVEPVKRDQFERGGVTLLTRVTIEAENPKKNYQIVLSNAANQSVDILAVRPLTLDATKHACQNYDVDIISINCASKRVIPNHAAAQVATSRGIFFEICYAQTFHTKERALFFTNVKRLVEVTRGNNLIFSSEALRALDIRQPSDLRMLGLLFGLRRDQVEAAVGHNCERLLLKAETRKSTVSAAIRVDMIPSAETVAQTENDNKRKREEENVGSKKKKKGKKQ